MNLIPENMNIYKKPEIETGRFTTINDRHRIQYLFAIPYHFSIFDASSTWRGDEI
jgi:hypothetical protein